jgi:hypothetical protein
MILLFLILFIVIIIIVILIYIFGGFKQNTPSQPNTSLMSLQYIPRSQWGWPKGINPDGKIIPSPFNPDIPDTKPYVEVSGPNGKCAVYTFRALNEFTPGVPMLRYINGCNFNTETSINGESVECQPSIASTLIDDDQILAKQVKHVCLGDLGFSIKTSGKCLGVDGTLYNTCETWKEDANSCKEGETKETFWVNCNLHSSNENYGDPTFHNLGNIGLVTFGSNINGIGYDKVFGVIGNYMSIHIDGFDKTFPNAVCLSSPKYTKTIVNDIPVIEYEINKEPIPYKPCDMRILDNYNFPSTLYRIERAIYNGGKYIYNSSGPFIRFTHRPTGLFVSPKLSNDVPLDNEPLVLNKASLEGGYWWYHLDTIINPDDSKEGIYQCYIYIPSPDKLPTFKDVKDIWKWLITNKPIAMKAEPNGVISTGGDPILSYGQTGNMYGIKIKPFNITSTDYVTIAIQRSLFCQDYDYAILPLLLNYKNI